MVLFNADAFRQHRLDWGFTQEALAAELDVDVRTIRSYERGAVNRPGRGFEVNRVKRQNILHLMAKALSLSGPEALLLQGPEVAPVTVALTQGQHTPAGEPYSERWYISRPAVERAAIDYLASRKPVILWGPEQIGKSWVLAHLVQRLHAGALSAATRITQVDLRSLGVEIRDGQEALLRQIAVDIGEQLADDEAAHDLAEQAWKRDGGGKNRLTWLLQECLARVAAPGLLILIVDHADEMLGHSFCDDFFSMMRYWLGKTRPPWDRLRLALALSTTPARLTTSVYCSPYHGLSEPIEIDRLDDEQALCLAARYRLPWCAAEIAALQDLLGGHPYLLRLVMYYVASGSTCLADILQHPGRNTLFERHLRHLREVLASSSMQALRQIAGAASDVPGPTDVEALRRCGLLVRDPTGRFRLRGRLYEALL